VSASSSSLSPLVATTSPAAVPAEELSAAQSIRLLQALSAVPDPRRRHSRRYSLQSILLIAVEAALTGVGAGLPRRCGHHRRAGVAAAQPAAPVLAVDGKDLGGARQRNGQQTQLAVTVPLTVIERRESSASSDPIWLTMHHLLIKYCRPSPSPNGAANGFEGR
jgi:hypothetical protein